jgi:hypothetical protein
MRDGAERDSDLVEDTSYLHTSSLRKHIGAKIVLRSGIVCDSSVS